VCFGPGFPPFAGMSGAWNSRQRFKTNSSHLALAAGDKIGGFENVTGSAWARVFPLRRTDPLGGLAEQRRIVRGRIASQPSVGKGAHGTATDVHERALRVVATRAHSLRGLWRLLGGSRRR
jgi:hypothetical protein